MSSPLVTSKTPYQIHQSITFSTYQKDHNLYLYLPPHSAHPPGITRSLIHGLIRKYWIQNTHSQDFHKMTKLLFQRLLARGHPENTLRSLFLQAAKNIDKTITVTSVQQKITKQMTPTPTKSFWNCNFIHLALRENNYKTPTLTPVNSVRSPHPKAFANYTQTTAQLWT